MENEALDIIDMLYTMIAEAWGVPLGNDKCIVERDKALGLLDDLKAVLPQELSEARRLVNARDEFVNTAKQEADTLRKNAADQAEAMIDKENVYLEAKKRGEEIIRDAEKKSKELRRAATNFLDDSLRQTEDAVAAALESVRIARTQVKAASAPEPVGKVDISLRDVEEETDLLGQ